MIITNFEERLQSKYAINYINLFKSRGVEKANNWYKDAVPEKHKKRVKSIIRNKLQQEGYII